MTRPLIVIAALALCCAAAPADSEEWNPPFPRLAMWWPDARPELRQEIARYDWVGVSGDEVDILVNHVKPLNPSLHVVEAVTFTETQAFESEENPARDARVLPAEYFLTQVGALLTKEVSRSDRVIKVSEARLRGKRLRFRRGDYVLCERETMRVLQVDYGKRLLRVRRGVFRRASAHSAGTRIAPAISFWPGSLVMNLSTHCPRVQMDPGRPPETWGEYVTRVDGRARDGVNALLVDRSDGNESWLIGNSTARSIDPSASNVQLDSYSSFDSAWNDGIRAMLTTLRAANPGLAVFSNNGYPAFDLLNGSVLEDVLYYEGATPSRRRWEQVVIGPSAEGAGYLEWLSFAQKPNYTLWECYEDHRGPDSIEGDIGNYENPASRPDFRPNYRQMRFGLTTALMSDGFFSYEISTFVHGGRWLMWFDEYDNAGQGRGYLGLPLGTMAVTLRDRNGEAAVFRRDFEHGIALVNPSNRSRTVSLERAFRRLRGRQAPRVNSGALVTRVRVPARDGRILLRAE